MRTDAVRIFPDLWYQMIRKLGTNTPVSAHRINSLKTVQTVFETVSVGSYFWIHKIVAIGSSEGVTQGNEVRADGTLKTP